METLPRGNKWKLMTTGGAATAQVLDLAPYKCAKCVLLSPSFHNLQAATSGVVRVEFSQQATNRSQAVTNDAIPTTH